MRVLALCKIAHLLEVASIMVFRSAAHLCACCFFIRVCISDNWGAGTVFDQN